MKTAHIVLGNQLLRGHPAVGAQTSELVIMIEAYDICAKLPYHKHKLILILAAMRDYRDFMRSRGVTVEYVELDRGSKFTTELKRIISEHEVSQLQWMRTSDVKPGQMLIDLCETNKLSYLIHPNQQFITSQSDFEDWHQSQKQPLMESFYRWQRKRTGILMDDGKPVGGSWNYDANNQKPLPKSGITIPETLPSNPSQNTTDVMRLVDDLFPLNPGTAAQFWLPTTFDVADTWLQDFISNKLCLFGDYEDASKAGEPFLFHSVLSPLINVGLLTPRQVVNAALAAYQSGSAPLNSVEGFVRQVIGWREYMHGMYQQRPELMEANYFGFSKELESWWYNLSYIDHDLPLPVRSVLDTLHTYGYNHHIERLMVLGNWFLLNEYNPQSVFRWFSTMYVDAYEWVMVPNVQGMSQYADGGVIATKPYISGGNYLQKMGRWWPNLDQAKASDYNRLYWEFLIKHRPQLQDNFRMGMVLKLAEKMVEQKS